MARCLDETKHGTNDLRQHEVLTEPVDGVAVFEAVSSKTMTHLGSLDVDQKLDGMLDYYPN
jgi:hypothetical protein